MTLDKAALIGSGSAMPTRTVDIPGKGQVVVRALSRAEAMAVAELKTTIERDKRMLVCGLVDPEMTFQDVEAWYKAAPTSEIELVSVAIARASGMMEEDEKEAYRRFREEQGA